MKINTNILVIGSGIAGLSFALKSSEFANVIIVTKKQKAESNTNYAQGGIASVISKEDDYRLHIKDTIECGAGLCHEDVVENVVRNGPKLINELSTLGVKFSKHGNELDLGKEGGHSTNRIVHAKDLTGKEVEKNLLHNISEKKNIEILEHHTAIELITEHHFKQYKKSLDNINCFGAYIFDEIKKEIVTIISDITVICTGGIGQVYLHTTNPEIATGDGIAMAYRSGCIIGNMEFVQFHPTSLYTKNTGKETHSFLISEALRGAGAKLRISDHKEFMYNYDKRGALAPRDIVARAIDTEMKKRGDDFVFLDITHMDKESIISKFPNIYKKCLDTGIDISKEYIPVVPAAHYICGGIQTNINGNTSIQNLYSLGESAFTGLHGANRLASNSLLEALVLADNASKSCKELLKRVIIRKISKSQLNSYITDWDDSGTENAEEWVLLSENKNEIKSIMSNYVGIVRSNLRLKRALRRIILLKNEIENYYKKTKITRELLELRNLVLIAYLIIKSAVKRKESRGLHYNTNYPNPNKKFLKDTLLCNILINE